MPALVPGFDNLLILVGQKETINPKSKNQSLTRGPDTWLAVMGQKVCAYIIPATEDGMTLEEIVSFLRSRQLAPYKLPERLEL